MDEDEIRKQFDESRKRHEELLNQNVDVILKIALEGFTTEEESILIGEGIKIKRVSLDERKEFYKRAAELDMSDHMANKNEFFLTYSYISQRKNAGGIETGARLSLISIFFAICGRQFININKGMLFLPKAQGYGSAGLWQTAYKSLKHKGNAIFNEGDIETLRKFWPSFIKNYNEVPHFSLVARRYYYSLSRYQWEDELIDLIIALEGLFLPEETKNKGGLMAKRLSKLLWNSHDRATVNKLAKECYNLRNQIVHGEIATQPENEVRNKVELLSDFVKEALQLFLVNYEGLSSIDFVKKIDAIKR